MKVLVIGASGGTGLHLVRKLLERGDDVTAYVRTPATFNVKHERLKIAQGDARDADALDRAVQGQDAVMSGFGQRSLGKTDEHETLLRNLVASMQKHGVKRLINLSAWGAGDSKTSGVVFWLFRTLVLRNVFADKNRAEALMIASPLDYINVRPGRLIDTPARGGVKASMDGEGIKPLLTREDLADFMIAQLASDQWARKSPIIGY